MLCIAPCSLYADRLCDNGRQRTGHELSTAVLCRRGDRSGRIDGGRIDRHQPYLLPNAPFGQLVQQIRRLSGQVLRGHLLVERFCYSPVLSRLSRVRRSLRSGSLLCRRPRRRYQRDLEQRLFRGEIGECDVFDQHCQTKEVNIEEAYAGDYDTLPEGSPNQDNMDGCIFIVDPDPETTTSQYIPNRPYSGNWYVYYGDGCYGSYATTSKSFISYEANCLNPDHFDDNGNHIGGNHIKAPITFVYGDADYDGEVTILDATVIQRVLIDMEWEPFNEKAADVNGNGLDVTDATLIQRFDAGMIDRFPIENETANG